MEFILLISDMPILATCKFEMLIIKGSQVIKYYVMFAFLFVQTVVLISFLCANSKNPDYAASDLDLHCLPTFHKFRASRTELMRNR